MPDTKTDDIVVDGITYKPDPDGNRPIGGAVVQSVQPYRTDGAVDPVHPKEALLKVAHVGGRPRLTTEARALRELAGTGCAPILLYPRRIPNPGDQPPYLESILVEKVDGEPLRDLLPSLSPASVLRIARQLRDVCEASHEKGVANLDWKLEDVFVDRRDVRKVRLVDWNTAVIRSEAGEAWDRTVRRDIRALFFLVLQALMGSYTALAEAEIPFKEKGVRAREALGEARKGVSRRFPPGTADPDSGAEAILKALGPAFDALGGASGSDSDALAKVGSSIDAARDAVREAMGIGEAAARIDGRLGQNDFDGARTILGRWRSLDPDDPDIRVWTERIDQREKAFNEERPRGLLNDACAAVAGADLETAWKRLGELRGLPGLKKDAQRLVSAWLDSNAAKYLETMDGDQLSRAGLVPKGPPLERMIRALGSGDAVVGLARAQLIGRSLASQGDSGRYSWPKWVETLETHAAFPSEARGVARYSPSSHWASFWDGLAKEDFKYAVRVAASRVGDPDAAAWRFVQDWIQAEAQKRSKSSPETPGPTPEPPEPQPDGQALWDRLLRWAEQLGKGDDEGAWKTYTELMSDAERASAPPWAMGAMKSLVGHLLTLTQGLEEVAGAWKDGDPVSPETLDGLRGTVNGLRQRAAYAAMDLSRPVLAAFPAPAEDVERVRTAYVAYDKYLADRLKRAEGHSLEQQVVVERPHPKYDQNAGTETPDRTAAHERFVKQKEPGTWQGGASRGPDGRALWDHLPRWAEQLGKGDHQGARRTYTEMVSQLVSDAERASEPPWAMGSLMAHLQALTRGLEEVAGAWKDGDPLDPKTLDRLRGTVDRLRRRAADAARDLSQPSLAGSPAPAEDVQRIRAAYVNYGKYLDDWLKRADEGSDKQKKAGTGKDAGPAGSDAAGTSTETGQKPQGLTSRIAGMAAKAFVALVVLGVLAGAAVFSLWEFQRIGETAGKQRERCIPLLFAGSPNGISVRTLITPTAPEKGRSFSSANETKFTWKTIDGASTYQVQVIPVPLRKQSSDNNDGPFCYGTEAPLGGAMDVSITGASIGDLDPGNYSWGVLALDHDDKIVGKSETRSFTVGPNNQGSATPTSVPTALTPGP